MTDSAETTPSSPQRGRWLRRLAYAAGAIAVLVAAAWLAVPPIVRSQLESRLTEGLGRKTTVEAVAFNPFTLRLTVRKLSIENPGGAKPLFAFDELVADLSSASIVHRAPVLDALKIVRPTLSLSRDAQGKYNVQDLVDRATSGPDGPPPRFSLNNIEVEDGSVAFDDGVAHRKHELASLNLGIPFLSTLPYQVDIQVDPRAEGVFNGSHFALSGTTVPFAERREASLDIDFDALPLAEYVAYLPAKPRVDLAGGALTTRLKLVFASGKGETQRLELRGDARIDGLALKRHDGSTLVAAERIAVALDAADFVHRDLRVASVAIDAPTVDLKRLADGTLEVAQPLFDAPGGVRNAAANAPAEKPWTATLAKATVARGSIALADAASAFSSSLVDVALDASNLSTKPGEKAHVALSFVTADRIASFKGEADVEPTVPAASGRFEFAKFSLALLFPYYKDVLAVEVRKGSLALASSFAVGADGDLRLTGGTASIDDLQLAFPGARDPLWRIPSLAAKGIDVDVAGRKASVDEITGSRASLRIAREHDGTLEAARFMKTTGTTGTDTADETWALTVRRFALDRVSADLEDRVPEPPVKLAARELSVEVGNYTNVRGGRSEVSLRTRLGESGRLSFNGPIVTNPFSMAGEIEATGLRMVAVRPYVESNVNVSVTGGTLALKGRLSVEPRENAPTRASWKGNVTVTDFAALDRPTSSDLARWKSLSLEGVDVEAAPFRASIRRIAAVDYFARVIVYPDGTLNLTRLLTPGAAPEPEPDAKPAPAAESPREAVPVSIGRIELANGNVNFSDFFVKPNYSANLTEVTGSISSMSAEQAGDVAISARVNSVAPVEVKGRLQPFAKEVALDLTGTARDVDLPPLSPYAIKYAGYGIEKGKLSFDVHYRIEDRKLSAENRLVLDQLVFNRERVDSPTATKLPVLLAVSLLKDRNGVIDIRLPISGSLDDPKFSIGGLIVQVIVNLIGKAVTAPFALLSAAFGGGGEELSTIPFAAGSAALSADAQKRIETLGKALIDRPGLKLEIGGHADPASDREALRRASVEVALKREKMKSMAAAGNAPASVDAVTIGADEKNRWLTAAYRDAPIEDKPRNVLGMLKEVPPAEMEAKLYAAAKVDDDALRLLANARAQAVKDALVAKGVAGDRLYLLAPKLGGEAGAQAAGRSAPGAAAAAATRVDLALR